MDDAFEDKDVAGICKSLEVVVGGERELTENERR